VFLQIGDGCVEMTCLYMVILAASVTNSWQVGHLVGLYLAGEVELRVQASCLVMLLIVTALLHTCRYPGWNPCCCYVEWEQRGGEFLDIFGISPSHLDDLSFPLWFNVVTDIFG
jgi:hypothetical protein